MGQQQTHYFYALKLPSDTKAELHEYCLKLQSEFPFARWVHREDYHITLAFLGHAPTEKLGNSKQLIQSLMGEFSPFPLSIQLFGTFGRKDSPRIFWAGVERAPKLDSIRAAVFSACKQVGFQLESRSFHPHITLARKWKGESAFPLTQVELEQHFVKPIQFQASEVVLYQTHVDRVPKYEEIATFSLS